MKRQVKEWLRYAKVDLLSAEKLLGEELLTQSVAFHIHQAVEKSLKAILENDGEKIPRIHDLEKLYGMILEKGKEMEIDEDILAQINDVYIDTRYPSDAGLIPEGIPSIKKVKEFYETDRKIYEKVMEIIES